MIGSSKNKIIKKKYNNSKLHFIMFLTSKKPVNISISKWIVYSGLLVLFLTLIFGSIFLYNTYSLKLELGESLSDLEKEVERLSIDKLQLDVENKSLKSSLDEKTEKVENALIEIENLQDSINKIKQIVGLPVDDKDENDDSSNKDKKDSSKSENDSLNKDILLAQLMSTNIGSRGIASFRDVDGINKESANIADKDKLDEISEFIEGAKQELENLLNSAEDREQYLKDVPIHYPTSGKITSPFGKRWGRLHKGLDISNNIGTKIYAAGNGVVLESRYSYSYGHSILIEHKNGFKTRYAHLSKRLVKKGEEVSQEDLIGLMGNTGTSYGSHLHYEIYYNNKPIDPLKITDYLKYSK